MVSIGSVEMKQPYALAPMAGVNCAAFRLLCKECGAGLICTQMYHSDFICHKLDTEGADAVYSFINIQEAERPVAIQLIGSKPEKMLKAALCVQGIADIIDINFGCSDDNMMKAKAGAYFLAHTDLIEPLVKPLVQKCSVPITAKIRIGPNSHSINGVAVAVLLESLGISAVAVHGRVTTQGYSGKANWEIIRHIKDKLKIPVIGNGDIRTPLDAEEMFSRTGCDMVMIGRRAMGDPGFFARCQGRDINAGELFPRFLDYHARFDAGKSFSEVRAHAVWFAKRMRLNAETRSKVARCRTLSEIRALLIDGDKTL
jgi:tRNA-dihydrouridine synthase B